MFHPVQPSPHSHLQLKIDLENQVALCGRQQVALPNKVRSSDTLVDHTPSVNTHKNITPDLCVCTLMLTLTPIDMYLAIHRFPALYSVENCPGLWRRFKPATSYLSSLLLLLVSPGCVWGWGGVGVWGCIYISVYMPVSVFVSGRKGVELKGS